ncbi:MAG: DUF2852 domain-containing protein [Alphaproteobacteria bacterium]
MQLAARLDDYGKPAWIGVMILGFIVFWPIGLGILAYLFWSGRMGCWRHGGPGRWHRHGTDREFSAGDWWSGGRRRNPASGNRAFDEYREETLHRLEEEQEEFQTFLEQLRHAKDKAEFDQFMAERGSRPGRPEAPEADDGPAPQAQT